MPLAEVLDALDYSQSSFYLKTEQKQEPEVAALFRAARSAGVDGIYVFRASSEKDPTFSVKPAVYVAEAQTPKEARKIHRCLWNLGQAPFLIVVLPNHIRVYTGFDYSQNNDRVGVVEPPISLERNTILERLGDFCAAAINNGQIWSKRSRYLKPERRIDKRLLKNLEILGRLLREEMGLPLLVAHALIGKYIYIRYLRDRGILSNQWLEEHNIDITTVLGRNATIDGLRQLCSILEDRFNGGIFPLDFDGDTAPTDMHVEWVASIFNGDEPLSGGVRQLSLLEFQAYDFAYIPIELLSSIYEQFLHAEGRGRQAGAYYTPEYLADYLISEMSAIKPLREGMKILDPSCGSGVFLVLIYARLIEMRLAQSGSSTLPLSVLQEILRSICGIERVRDACFIAEFSLILTLLQYADTREFLYDERSKLPSLHNTHIFQCDFFDDSSQIWIQGMQFDWIIGNPPWTEADSTKEPLAYAWISANKKRRPVDNNSVAEAFSWRVLDLLTSEGYIGRILPASLLLRMRGGRKGLTVSEPPHIVMNAGWKYCIFSDTYFVIKPRQIGLSAPPADADYLRALSVFLSSDLVRYYLFFQAPQWGIERDVITLNTVKSIPIPKFSSEQIAQLAYLQKSLVSMELERGSDYAQAFLSRRVVDILQIPESVTILANEFLQLRVGLVGGGTREAVRAVQQRPDRNMLTAYAQQLTRSLDSFLDSGRIHHRVAIEQSPNLICCTVDFVQSEHAFEPVIKDLSSQDGQAFYRLQQNLKQQFSQWVYVQRGLKIFGPSSVSLYKVPQLINWTRTQAMNDADDMIAEILSMERRADAGRRRGVLGE